MRIAYFPLQAALNSQPVIAAFLAGCKQLGIETVENSTDADAAMIWSGLFQGRMLANKRIYEFYRKQDKPVFILEVGSLKRGILWRISLNNINRLAHWGNEKNLNLDRPATLGLFLHETRQIRAETILIACQHERSLQWQGQPAISTWVNQTIDEVRKYTDRPIIVRPHPRYRISSITGKGVRLENPKLLSGTYDDFDINYNHHCVINFSSGPSIQAPISGTPIICDSSSLAYPVSTSIDQIENPRLPDRTDWFTKLAHTEWSIEEIATGMPIYRLLEK